MLIDLKVISPTSIGLKESKNFNRTGSARVPVPKLIFSSARQTTTPPGKKAGLKVTLGDAIAEIDFGFISSAPLTISCLDAHGHCVAIFQTNPEVQPAEVTHDPTVQGVTFDTRGTKTVRIDCRAPFVLTRFGVKQATA